MIRSLRQTLVFLVLLALLLATQLSLASQRSFWEDEAATARLSTLSYSAIITERAQDNHPPLYWLLVSAWGWIFGQDELGLRSFSILCLVGVLALVYVLAGKFYSSRAAWLASLLLVLSPFVLTYGHNARYYAFAACLSLLALLGADHFLEDHKPWGLAGYTLTGISLIYTIYMGATVLLGINLWWLVRARRGKYALRQIVAWLFAQGLIVLSYLPWLGTLAGATARNFDPAFSLASLPSALAVRLGYLGFAYSVGEFFSPLHPLVWLGIGLSLLLLVSALRRLDAPTGLLASVLAVIISARSSARSGMSSTRCCTAKRASCMASVMLSPTFFLLICLTD